MSYRTAAIAAAVSVSSVFAGSPVAAQPPLKKIVYEGVDASVIHGFSVALVLGDLQGTASPESLPVGAKKALADLRDFLPYKSYRLLDAQWILCCADAKAGIAGRLRGTDEQTYGFVVDVLGVSGSRLSLRFSLRDDTFKKMPAKVGEDVAVEILSKQQQQEKAFLEALLEEERRRSNPKAAVIQDLQSKLEKIRREADDKPRTVLMPPKGSIIDSTFSMDVGETVVIGTSGLKGDKALIALLTAVRRSSTAPGEKR